MKHKNSKESLRSISDRSIGNKFRLKYRKSKDINDDRKDYVFESIEGRALGKHQVSVRVEERKRGISNCNSQKRLHNKGSMESMIGRKQYFKKVRVI